MELWLTLRFRGSPLGIRDRFPFELAFIARQLRSLDGPEVPPSERVSTAHVQVSPEQAKAILSWGRMRTVDGLSLIHISEPTRLLSISYAVFCLKKKTFF